MVELMGVSEEKKVGVFFPMGPRDVEAIYRLAL